MVRKEVGETGRESTMRRERGRGEKVRGKTGERKGVDREEQRPRWEEVRPGLGVLVEAVTPARSQKAADVPWPPSGEVF